LHFGVASFGPQGILTIPVMITFLEESEKFDVENILVVVKALLSFLQSWL